MHEPFIYLSSHHLVFYHSLSAVIYLTDIIFVGQRPLEQTSELLTFFDKNSSEGSQQSHTVLKMSKQPDPNFNLGIAGFSPQRLW